MTLLPARVLPVPLTSGGGVPAGSRGLGRPLRSAGPFAAASLTWVVVLLTVPDIVPAHGLLLAVGVFVALQTAARSRPQRTLWSRDSQSITRSLRGRAGVAVALASIPALVLFQSYRLDRYASDSWTALLTAGALLVAYALGRRLVVAVAAAALAVAVTTWTLAPDLSTATTGDRVLLAQLQHERSSGLLNGLAGLSAALVDPDAPQPVRLAGIGATADTPMEVGSLTKAMTGLLIADAVRRGEVDLDVPVAEYLPELSGSPAGRVTLHELATHTAGYTDFGHATTARAAWKAPLGLSFTDTGMAQMTSEIRNQDLAGRGTFRYSNLGAATAGQAVAAASGLSYPELMRTRLFQPLGMANTRVQTNRPLVNGGTSGTGLRVRPWLFDAYAPAGAVVSTAADLATLAAAVLDGTAPGADALAPTTATAKAGSDIGMFWVTSVGHDGQPVTWHTGQTGGYSSYIGLDLARRTAVVVLCNVAPAPTEKLGLDLLASGS